MKKHDDSRTVNLSFSNKISLEMGEAGQKEGIECLIDCAERGINAVGKCIDGISHQIALSTRTQSATPALP